MNNSFWFKKGDLEIEFSGQKDFVENQIREWRSLMEPGFISPEPAVKQKNQAAEQEPLPEYREISVKKNISIQDFIDLKKPENNPDKIMVAAYYLEKYEKLDFFNVSDINSLIRTDDPERYLLLNLEKGFLTVSPSEDNQKNYTLTYSGEMYVKEGLQE